MALNMGILNAGLLCANWYDKVDDPWCYLWWPVPEHRRCYTIPPVMLKQPIQACGCIRAQSKHQQLPAKWATAALLLRCRPKFLVTTNGSFNSSTTRLFTRQLREYKYMPLYGMSVWAKRCFGTELHPTRLFKPTMRWRPSPTHQNVCLVVRSYQPSKYG